ncbi:MAG: DUF6279 family lipoprotein [Pseudomonadota bacterium]
MIWRCALLLLALSGLSACNTGMRLAYQNLDTLLRLEIGSHVELDPAQDALLDGEFEPLLAWHRRNELPAYALALRRTAELVEQGSLDRTAVDGIADTIRAAVERLGEQALPGIARLLASLDEAQVKELLASQQKEWDEELETFEDETATESLQRLTDKLEERIENWVGPLKPAQRAYLSRRMAEADARGEFTDARLKAEAEQDQQAFAALLATRQQTGFAARLRALAYPQDAVAEAERSTRRERSRSFYTALAATLTPKQRAHLAKRLRSSANDASVLAAKPGP